MLITYTKVLYKLSLKPVAFKNEGNKIRNFKSQFSFIQEKKIKSPYLILIPCLYILHASEGRIRESKGTVVLETKGKNYLTFASF